MQTTKEEKSGFWKNYENFLQKRHLSSFFIVLPVLLVILLGCFVYSKVLNKGKDLTFLDEQSTDQLVPDEGLVVSGEMPEAYPTEPVTTLTWSSLPAGGTPRYMHAASVMGSTIYYSGGFDGGSVIGSISAYDTVNGTWTNYGMGSGYMRMQHVSFASNSTLYVMGGLDENYAISGTNPRFIYQTYWEYGGWSPTPARQGHVAVQIGNLAYVWGGITNSSPLTLTNDLIVADANLDLTVIGTWTRKAAGGTARYGYTGTAVGDKIYFWGGNITDAVLVDVMDVYDTTSNSWTAIGPGTYTGTPKLRTGHAAAAIGTKIYAAPVICKDAVAVKINWMFLTRSRTPGQWEPTPELLRNQDLNIRL
jgi:hypothetical protein